MELFSRPFDWNEYTLNTLTRGHWRASLVPLAAVIQPPIAAIVSIFQFKKNCHVLQHVFQIFNLKNLPCLPARASNFLLKKFCHVPQLFPHFTHLSACSLDCQLLPFFFFFFFLGGGGLWFIDKVTVKVRV